MGAQNKLWKGEQCSSGVSFGLARTMAICYRLISRVSLVCGIVDPLLCRQDDPVAYLGIRQGDGHTLEGHHSWSTGGGGGYSAFTQY